MTGFEHTFPPEELYLSEYQNRVEVKAIKYGSIYTAVSKLKPLFSRPERTVTTFPVTVERIDSVEIISDESFSTLALISFKLILLNEDYHPKPLNPLRAHMKTGYWQTEEHIFIKEIGAEPISGGYLLETAPSSFTPDDVIQGNYFPVDFDLQ
jgi:hypothetical protein